MCVCCLPNPGPLWAIIFDLSDVIPHCFFWHLSPGIFLDASPCVDRKGFCWFYLTIFPRCVSIFFFYASTTGRVLCGFLLALLIFTQWHELRKDISASTTYRPRRLFLHTILWIRRPTYGCIRLKGHFACIATRSGLGLISSHKNEDTQRVITIFYRSCLWYWYICFDVWLWTP